MIDLTINEVNSIRKNHALHATILENKTLSEVCNDILQSEYTTVRIFIKTTLCKIFS